MVRKRIISIASLLVVLVCIAFIIFFNNQSLASANIITSPIRVTEDTTIVYEGINAGRIYEDGNLGYLDVGYQGSYGVPLEVQVLLKFNLPTIPAGYEVETANLYIPVTGGTFQGATDFSLKVSTSTNNNWTQDNVMSPPAPSPGSTQSRTLANNVPILKPTLAPFDFTSYISGEFTKATPRATFILSGMTVQEAAENGMLYVDHFIQMTESNMHDGNLGPYLIITYSEIVDIAITGIDDGGLYNRSVTPQFNIGTATLNGSQFTSGTQVTAEGSYTLTVTAGNQSETIQFRIDKTPPTGTVIVNGGNSYTNLSDVLVEVTPATGVTDITNIRYTINGSAPTTIPYRNNFELNVGSTDGAKAITIELIDGAGNISLPYTSTITLDTVVPTGTVVINNGDAYTAERKVNLALTPVVSVTDVVYVKFSSDNLTWSVNESYIASKTYTFTLPAGDGYKTVYVQFINHAGTVGSAQDSIILDMTAPVVTGVADGESYNSARTITFDEGIATLNGNSFINGSPVDDEGTYILVVTDAAGNSTTITFGIIKYRVSYDGNGTTGGLVPIDSQIYETGDRVTVADNTRSLVRTGFTFNGWNTEADGSGTSYAANETFNISAANVTLYAIWDVNHYTLSFESNGGSIVANQNKSYNETATEPSAPTKPGYTFGGWYKEITLTNQWIFTKDLVTANTTLYAKWVGNSSSGSNGGGGYIPTPPQNSTVYFETNGGNVIVNLSVANESRLAELPTPTKEGFTFGGWYQDNALTHKWDYLTDRVTQTTKFYAKWIANTSPATGPGQEPEPTPGGPKPELPVVSFDDISGHWAKGMIEELASQGIITGYPDGSFHPNESIQRQHMALIFMRAFEFEPTHEVVSFSDISSSHPYYEAIASLQQAGIVDGLNGRFNPNEPVTRAQMAKIIALALKVEPSGTSTFQDVPLAHWSYAYIAALEELGIVQGDNGKFNPNEPVTRAEFVAMLYRALNLT